MTDDNGFMDKAGLLAKFDELGIKHNTIEHPEVSRLPLLFSLKASQSVILCQCAPSWTYSICQYSDLCPKMSTIGQEYK